MRLGRAKILRRECRVSIATRNKQSFFLEQNLQYYLQEPCGAIYGNCHVTPEAASKGFSSAVAPLILRLLIPTRLHGASKLPRGICQQQTQFFGRSATHAIRSDVSPMQSDAARLKASNWVGWDVSGTFRRKPRDKREGQGWRLGVDAEEANPDRGPKSLLVAWGPFERSVSRPRSHRRHISSTLGWRLGEGRERMYLLYMYMYTVHGTLHAAPRFQSSRRITRREKQEALRPTSPRESLFSRRA